MSGLERFVRASTGSARTVKTRLLAMTVVVFLFAGGVPAFAERAVLKAGVARVEITPSVGTPLAGYSKRHGKPSTGIRDPLYVRALVLTQGQETAVFVSGDMLIFPRPMAEAILRKVSKELKISRNAIILSATHTHTGPGAIAPGFLYEIVFGSYRPQIVEGISARVIWAIRQALKHQQPVRWGTGSGVLPGLIENRRDPGTGIVDPEMGVFMVESMKGEPLGAVVNAAAHPTLLGSQEMRFSADFPGELTRLMESSYPGLVCLFVNGAAGDVRPGGSVGTNSEERLKRFAQALAEESTGVVNQMKIESKANLATWGRRISLPPPQLKLGGFTIPSPIGRLMRPSSTYLNLIALDKTLFVPLPAEITAQLGMDLKRRLSTQGKRAILFGYANGYLGYAVTPEQYKAGGYESWMTWYGPFFGQSLVEQIAALAGAQSDGK